MRYPNSRLLARRKAAATLLLALIFASYGSLAVDENAATDSDALEGSSSRGSASTDALQEIIVSANKRVEDIKDVPISITAISGQELLDKRIQDRKSVV